MPSFVLSAALRLFQMFLRQVELAERESHEQLGFLELSVRVRLGSDVFLEEAFRVNLTNCKLGWFHF